MIKLEDYVFNLEKFLQIKNKNDKNLIQNLFDKLIIENNINPKSSNFVFIYNTLLYNGFLVNKNQLNREKLLDSLDV